LDIFGILSSDSGLFNALLGANRGRLSFADETAQNEGNLQRWHEEGRDCSRGTLTKVSDFPQGLLSEEISVLSNISPER